MSSQGGVGAKWGIAVAMELVARVPSLLQRAGIAAVQPSC